MREEDGWEEEGGDAINPPFLVVHFHSLRNVVACKHGEANAQVD